MEKTPRVRFAPSPTGYLHLGNIRAAVLNFLFAYSNRGEFILRIDDTDTKRSNKEYESSIFDDLAFLGLHPTRVIHQSDRLDRYAHIANLLKKEGFLYPCYETSDELEEKRKTQAREGKPPVYDRTALRLTTSDCHALEQAGRRPHMRFKLARARASFHDLIRGTVPVDTFSLSDPVLIKEDGQFLYTLTSVVDDVDYNITHIIRGADHITNTCIQIQILRAVDFVINSRDDFSFCVNNVKFAHYPLIKNAYGKPLSKRDAEDMSIRMLRKMGYDPMVINSFLSSLGTSHAPAPLISKELASLAQDFALENYGKSEPIVCVEDIKKLNAKFLQAEDYLHVEKKLSEMGYTRGEEFFKIVQNNSTFLHDVQRWSQLLVLEENYISSFNRTKECQFEIERAGRFFFQEALHCLPEIFCETVWETWCHDVSCATQKKGKALFKPLRAALTGAMSGPSMGALLPFFDRQIVEKRLEYVLEYLEVSP